jgi:hypothetical protein
MKSLLTVSLVVLLILTGCAVEPVEQDIVIKEKLMAEGHVNVTTEDGQLLEVYPTYSFNENSQLFAKLNVGCKYKVGVVPGTDSYPPKITYVKEELGCK